MVVKVVIRGLRGEELEINLCDTEEQLKNITVRELRRRIDQRGLYTDTDNIRLIFTCEALDDDNRRLSDYGVQHMSVIQVVIRVPGGGCPCPMPGAGGMGDRDGRNRSMERLGDFRCPLHSKK